MVRGWRRRPRGVQDLLKPFLLACESKNAKLASIALVSFQKLLANDAVSDEGVQSMIRGLEQVGPPPPPQPLSRRHRETSACRWAPGPTCIPTNTTAPLQTQKRLCDERTGGVDSVS